eukprot:TRINITY_DN5220_c0_g1_i1.p1 TRINITY_DN5220_c0_g1~~TRINITY_DN5220_c0_g1_i1.p1  ORF type:complete len:326 (+),score=76.95 TRINITY_DN5220_c0_g1_i1:144-1121(+)
MLLHRQLGNSLREEKAPIPGQKKNVNMKVVEGQKDITGTLSPEFAHAKSTVYFKNCYGCKFTLETTVVKVLIERCYGCTFTLNGKIMTSTIEIWKCDDCNVNIGSTVMTLQVDMVKKLELKFAKKEQFNSLIWAGAYDLRLTFGDSDDVLTDGYEEMKKIYTDIDDKFDQFIVRFIDGKLISEQIIRLKNGFPTTQREADTFDEQKKANDEKVEEYVRQLLDTNPSPLGLKRLKQKDKGAMKKPRNLKLSSGDNTEAYTFAKDPEADSDSSDEECEPSDLGEALLAKNITKKDSPAKEAPKKGSGKKESDAKKDSGKKESDTKKD